MEVSQLRLQIDYARGRFGTLVCMNTLVHCCIHLAHCAKCCDEDDKDGYIYIRPRFAVALICYQIIEKKMYWRAEMVKWMTVPVFHHLTSEGKTVSKIDKQRFKK